LRAFADTNVLAYALDRADPDKQRRAQHLLEAHGDALTISTQVLIELYAVCVRKLGMSSLDSAAAVRAASRIDVVPTDRDLVLDAAALATERGISVFDATILSAAIRAECELLLSEDLALAAVAGPLEIVNPFA